MLHQLIQNARPNGWPVNNLFYQPLLETSLAEGLARYPQVSVRRGREFTRFIQDDQGVTVSPYVLFGGLMGLVQDASRLDEEYRKFLIRKVEMQWK